MKKLHEAGLFEGVTREANHVYAYDLVITDHQGKVRRTRDAYSFLPTLGETDLYLFGKGDERTVPAAGRGDLAGRAPRQAQCGRRGGRCGCRDR